MLVDLGDDALDRLALEFEVCLVGNESGADGQHVLNDRKVVFHQRLARFDDIDDDVGKTQDGCDLDRAVQVNDINVTPLGGVVPTGDV